MHEWKVFSHPQRGVTLVKQGWSWPAFFFTGLWSLVKDMWGLTLGMSAMFLVVGFLAGLATADMRVLMLLTMELTVTIMFGKRGNGWVCDRLMLKGYTPAGTVMGPTLVAAKAAAARRGWLKA